MTVIAIKRTDVKVHGFNTVARIEEGQRLTVVKENISTYRVRLDSGLDAAVQKRHTI